MNVLYYFILIGIGINENDARQQQKVKFSINLRENCNHGPKSLGFYLTLPQLSVCAITNPKPLRILSMQAKMMENVSSTIS